MHRFVTVLALALLAACATTDEPRLDRFDTVDIGELSDFTAYDSVYLVPSIANDEVMELTNIRTYRATRPEQPLDEMDIKRKLADFDDSLKEALGEKVTLVDAPGPGVLVIRPVLTALEANRPDLTRAGRIYPGITRVFAVGDAAVIYQFAADGETIGTLTDSTSDRVLNERGFLPIGVWETADRFFNRSASSLASLF
ncbi:MAG: DUF3313 family protein [Pseudomonadota bacterium]